MIKVRVGYQDSQQRWIIAVESWYCRKVLFGIVLCVQWQTKINQQALSKAFDRNTAPANLVAATKYASSHDSSFIFSFTVGIPL
jgi:hypothetical protein